LERLGDEDGIWVWKRINALFNWLPLAFVLKKQVLVLHGGLFSQDGVTLDDLRKVQRNRCATEPSCAVYVLAASERLM